MALFFFAAPYIAFFYGNDVLTQVIRVFGIRILITAFNNIQQSYIQREMMFKKFFIATLFGTIVSCALGIWMAYNGFGVWALVTQYMTNSIINTIVLFFVSGWEPRLQFSKKSAKVIYSFGFKLLCSQLIYTLSNDIRSLIIGKVFGASDLAYYEQGKKYPAVIVDNVNVAITKVMLPTFARAQDDIGHLKNILRKTIRIGVFIIAPIMLGFATVSDNFIIVVLTDKWLQAVPFLQIACISYLTRPLEEFCHRAILAMGRSGTAMYIMIIINTISLFLTMVATFVIKSVLWIALFYLIHTLVALICFLFTTNKYIGYNLYEQISDIAPSILISTLMCAAVYLMKAIPFSPFIILILQVICGVALYVILAKVFKLEQLNDLVILVKSYFHINHEPRMNLSDCIKGYNKK